MYVTWIVEEEVVVCGLVVEVYVDVVVLNGLHDSHLVVHQEPGHQFPLKIYKSLSNDTT